MGVSVKFRFLTVASLSLFASSPALAQSMTLGDVTALSGMGIGDEAIIAKIKASNTHIDLTTAQMIELKKGGVSGPVIAALYEGAGE